MSYEVSPVTTYRTLNLRLEWIVKNWRLSPGYVISKKRGRPGSIVSPLLQGAAGSEWQFVIDLHNLHFRSLETVVFQCRCIKEPRLQDEECVVEGSICVTSCENEDFSHRVDVDCEVLAASLLSGKVTLGDQAVHRAPNCLTLSADFTVFGAKHTSGLSTRRSSGSAESNNSMATFLAELATDSNFTDFTIEVEGEEVRAHRAVLAARSPVLRAMVSADMREKREARIVLPDVSCAAWRTFQTFLYTDVLDPPQPDDVALLLEVLMLSDKYGVLSLKQRVGEAILPCMAPENVLEIYEATQNFALVGLREAACDVILGNWETLRKERRMLAWIASGNELASALFEKLRF